MKNLTEKDIQLIYKLIVDKLPEKTISGLMQYLHPKHCLNKGNKEEVKKDFSFNDKQTIILNDNGSDIKTKIHLNITMDVNYEV